MPNIITCFKWVIDERDIRAAAGSRELLLDRVGYKISEYDRNAIEEATRLHEAHGGSLAAITVGTPAAKKSLKDVLSRGPEKAYFVNDPAFADLDPAQTAEILAESIQGRIEYDLIICGEGSSDLYAQQVGPRLAELLGIPSATYVNKLTFDGQQLVAERKVDDGIEVVTLTLPALVTVLPDINSPRIPGLKQTMEAAKKPVVEITAKELSGSFPPSLATVKVLGTSMERNCQKFGHDEAELARLVDTLIKDGVLA